MSALVQIVIKPQQQEDLEFIYRLGLQKAKLNPDEVIDWRIRKRSLDARKAAIKMNVQLEFWKVGEVREPTQAWTAKTVDPEKKIAIIGAGPAGLYAALRAIEAGITPVVFERGKDVRARRRDLAAINKAQTVNPESNYCFGEGGAGTYSDGKLYTRSKKRGNVLKALEWLVHFGASDNILVEAHPHIGTNKLPAIITAMREAVIAHGGAVHFNAKLTDIKIENNSIKGLEINGDTWHNFSELVLATGHSARDIFYLLHKRGVTIAAKPFALGVRVEHTQELINDIQYHGDNQNPYLPPASYALVEQVNGMGVY